MISVENLCLTRDGNRILDGLNLTVDAGEVVGVIGPSGTGKSVLLKCIMNLAVPDSGTVTLDGTQVTPAVPESEKVRGKIGMVFQNFNLFNHLTVLENVMAGPVDLLHEDRKTAYEKAMRLIRRVGLSDRAYAFPSILSGGQQQRAAIARALAMDPQVVLMDEPTSALDPLAKGEVETVIRMMAPEGRTMIIVSHEMEVIRRICTRVVFLYNGKVWEDGTPEKLFDHPERPETRRFVQALRVLEMDVDSADFDFIGLQTTLSEYAYRTGIPAPLLTRLQSTLEEFFHIIILDADCPNRLHLVLEFDEKSGKLYGNLDCTGDPIDVDDPHYYLSWRIIGKRVDDLQIKTSSVEGYTNHVRFVL